MKNPSSSIPNPFTIGYIFLDSRMIHYMTNHVIFPRKGNFGLITQFDVEVVWVIKNKIKVNMENELIKYMMEARKKEYVFHMLIWSLRFYNISDSTLEKKSIQKM